jgi:putative acetyltransferase
LITFRHETPADREAIFNVEAAAFGRHDEAHLVDTLRDAGNLLLSMVADVDGELVGHVAFSPIALDPANPPVSAVALGPIAVAPTHQGRGVGATLIRHALEELRAAGAEVVILLGEPAYYARFGFVPASTMGVLRPEDPPDHVSRYLQLVELAPGALAGVRRRASYAPEFTPAR